jgi:hypothetical protein
MDPMRVFSEDIHSLILPPLELNKLFTLMEVNSTWRVAVKEVLKKRFFFEYIPSGENLATYQAKYCVDSPKELKGRIQKFLRQVGCQPAVFICSFPFNEFSAEGSPAFLVIKWNPRGSTDDFFLSPWTSCSYVSDYPHEYQFFERDYPRIVPYLFTENKLEKLKKTLSESTQSYGPEHIPYKKDFGCGSFKTIS